jgi:hypothetical protein
MKKFKILVIILAGIALINMSCSTREGNQYDVCVYSGTSSEVMAAYKAAKTGKKVLLIEPARHLGGMTASGLGMTDIGDKEAITGNTRKFYQRIAKHYGEEGKAKLKFEPHVAENIFNQMVEEAGFDTLLYHRVIKVNKKGAKITSIVLENSKNPASKPHQTIHAKVFIDCSYEGDLMARAGVSYTIGREDNSKYGETYNGFQFRKHCVHQFPDSISPYVVPGDSTSGLVYGITENGFFAETGAGDKNIQVYNYRVCITKVDSNKVPITKPDNYDPKKYELLARIGERREWTTLSVPPFKGEFALLIIDEMPNGKTDVNNYGGFSTDFIGENWEYPEADYATREKLTKAHEDYQKGLFYFIGHSPRIPEKIRNEMLEYGYCKDEFTDNGGWPFQLYVREARRMIGEYVMTEHNWSRDTVVDDGVAIASYGMDSHNTQRIIVDGMVKNEGDVQAWRGEDEIRAYPVSYRSITPKREECINLLVPVCLSATHIAYGSIRMEPVFMMLGEAAGAAASLAIDAGSKVQEVNYDELKKAIDYSLTVKKYK